MCTLPAVCRTHIEYASLNNQQKTRQHIADGHKLGTVSRH